MDGPGLALTAIRLLARPCVDGLATRTLFALLAAGASVVGVLAVEAVAWLGVRVPTRGGWHVWSFGTPVAMVAIALVLALLRCGSVAACLVEAHRRGDATALAARAVGPVFALSLPWAAAVVGLVAGLLDSPMGYREGVSAPGAVRVAVAGLWLLADARYLGLAPAALVASEAPFADTLRACVDRARERPALALAPSLAATALALVGGVLAATARNEGLGRAALVALTLLALHVSAVLQVAAHGLGSRETGSTVATTAWRQFTPPQV